MCGIAGIIKFPNTPTPWSRAPNTPLDSRLQNMSNAIAHRGPDGSGHFLDAHAALLHRRLAIIDQPTGQQPMPNETADVHVIFNGEIYNHAELRQQLLAAGHQFRSHHSDTETLVHGWEQWGIDLPSKLRGMFAFALWDTRPNPSGQPRNTLFLARDRMGQKPLFYATLDDGIVFASTIPAILAWPEVPRRVPREQIALYLQYGYLPAPTTIFRDISQLSPGHWLRLRGEVLDGNAYWSPTPGSRPDSPPNSPIENPKSTIENLLTQAVESQLIADTPIACFLSGGVDSSIIALLLQQALTRRGSGPLTTISAGFADPDFDESAKALAVAQHIGSRHHRLDIRPDQNVFPTLQKLMSLSLGQPFADSSILPTFLLSQAARNIAPVALSGDGADELFGGYDRYRALKLLARLNPLAPFMPKSIPLGSISKRERYRRLANAAREKSPTDQYTRLLEITPPELIEQLFGEPPDVNPAPDNSTLSTPHSALRRAMLRDQQDYLPNDVLYKVDTASMANALEVRSPFLDHHLVEFANSLADDTLMPGGQSKAILKQIFAPELPMIFGHSKKGFGVPIGQWFQSTLRTPLHDLLFSATSFTTQHLHRPTVQKLLNEHHQNHRDHTHRLFALLMLELFYQSFSPNLV